MIINGKLITIIYNHKGGAGNSTICSSIVKKINKYKKTIIITNSPYSNVTYKKCGIKSEFIVINDLTKIKAQITSNDKAFKKFEYIFFDISGMYKIEEKEIEELLKIIDIVILPLIPDQSINLLLQHVDTLIEKNNANIQKYLTVLSHIKPHYNANKLDEVIKEIDNWCRKHTMPILPRYFGYCKPIENDKRILDTKTCKPCLLDIVCLLNNVAKIKLDKNNVVNDSTYINNCIENWLKEIQSNSY